MQSLFTVHISLGLPAKAKLRRAHVLSLVAAYAWWSLNPGLLGNTNVRLLACGLRSRSFNRPRLTSILLKDCHDFTRMPRYACIFSSTQLLEKEPGTQDAVRSDRDVIPHACMQHRREAVSHRAWYDRTTRFLPWQNGNVATSSRDSNRPKLPNGNVLNLDRAGSLRAWRMA